MKNDLTNNPLKINLKASAYQAYVLSPIRQSPTEKRISIVLNKNNIRYISECSFVGFGHPKFPYRFDFYIPDHNLIIEYDGKHHSKPHMKLNDGIKNKFCKVNNIKIVRYNIKHYDRLEYYVNKLIKNLTKKTL